MQNKTSKFTQHERAARRAVRDNFNYFAGGLVNSATDGVLAPEETPTKDILIEDIYGETIGRLNPTEIRFAGKEFIMAYARQLVEGDEELAEILKN